MSRTEESQARPVQSAGRDQAGSGSSTVSSVLAQQAALARFGQRALAEQRLELLLSEAVTLVARLLETELVSVAQLEPDGDLRVVAGVGWRPGVVGEQRLGAGAGSQSGYALKADGPLVVEDLSRETRFQVVGSLVEHGAVSGMSARIGEEPQLYGVLSAFTSRRGRFSRDDANFLHAVASVLAGAVGRLRIESELRRSRDELAAIVGTVRDGILVRGRDGQLLYANEPAARMNRHASPETLVVASAGEPDTRFSLFDELGRPVPVDELPSRACLRTGRQTDEQLVRVRWEDGEERWQIIQASPVHAADGSVEKVVEVTRDITDERRTLETRQFLTEALATLSSVLDSAEQARQLADLCVPHLADYCAIDLVEPDGSISRAALARLDQHDAPAPPADQAEAGANELALSARVIAHGRPVVAGHPPDGSRNGEGQPAATPGPPGMPSWLCVPLLAHSRPIGALTLGRSPDAGPLDEHDVRLAEELGARAGILLENARLYQAADERRSELDAILTAMADAVLVFDARGRLRLTNRAAEQLFEGSPPRTVGQLGERIRPGSIEHSPDSGGGQGQRPRTASHSLARLEGEFQLSSSVRWFELRHYQPRGTPAEQQAEQGPFVVVLRDVTEARAARAARDAFLGVLSHELRTPITTVYGGSELLERPLDEERRAEVLRDIRGESERLARLVEDLLVMSRVERGGVDIGDEPVLLQRLVPRIVSSMGARLPALKAELKVGEHLPAVRSDPTYLEQVLRNLLTNAMRYGAALEKGVEIVVGEADDGVEVRVLDRGPGLDEDDLEQLFELFYRSPAAQVVPGGAGIGLFVCRRLIEAMGGRTWALPRAGGGAEFGFSLPIIEFDLA